jgi:PAS domain S-box-containing protein
VNGKTPQFTFSQLVDIGQIEELLTSHQAVTGVSSAIVDVEENILVATGWQEICTRFHRVHPLSCARCRESDAYIHSRLDSCADGLLEYRCKNGLWDVALPILVAGRHLATLFIGQFFYDDDRVDMEFFRNQARECGFDVHEYLKAVGRVPRYNRERVRATMNYHRNLVRVMAENGLKNLKLAQEVEDRRRTERALLESEATLRAITRSARDAIVMIDDQGRVTFWNAMAEEMLGWEAAEVLGRDLHLVVAPRRCHDEYYRAMGHFVRFGQGNAIGRTLELSALRRDATEIPVELSLSSVMLDGRWHAVGIIRNISERKRAEEMLQASEERYRKFASLTSDYVFRCSRVDQQQYRIQWMGGAVEAITGYSQEEMYEKGCWLSIVHPDDGERIGARLMAYEPGMRDSASFRIITKSGQVRWLKESCCCERGGAPGELVLYGTSQDITEQEVLHGQLLKTQKLESLGVFAGGIAHDFNNLLTGIIANISLAKVFVTPTDKIFTRLDEAERAADRARDLTQQLLTFSRGGAPVKKSASLEQILMDSVSFVLRGSNVRCEFMVPEDIWPVEVDVGQISQVINNLLINADQAMPQGGTVRVRIENLVAGPCDTLPLGEGRYVKCSVADQGTGIPEDLLSRIFDPYFTTKQKGSGLGLATVHSIVKKHGGHIGVESRVGVGTVFHLYLPAATREAPPPRREEEKQQVGRGKVLFMDDEEVIREVACEILGFLGYGVRLCSDGAEAIEEYQMAMERGEPFDAVIMDLTVPGGMGGKEAMKKLREIDGSVRGIVSSGYCNDPILSHYREYGFCAVVAKPYNIKEMGEVMHEVIMRSA